MTTLNERLDAIANATGIPQLTAHKPRRRPQRGFAIITLLLGTLGVAIMLVGERWFWVGEAVLMAGFSLSAWLPIKGPIKPWLSTEEKVDERDEAIRANAYLAALPTILLVAVLALWTFPGIALLQHRSLPETVALCGFAAIYLILLWNAVPTLHASWQRVAEDDDEG